MKPISIILKTWNALPHVRLCARALLRNTDVPFELIIIDNGSRPETISFLRGLAQDSRVRLVENRENVGPGAANRQGFALAAGDLVCLLDSDVLAPARWLSRLLAEFQQHPGVKLLAPLNYHPAIEHPFDGADSAAAWFAAKQEQPRGAPLQQFHAYSRGLTIDEFDALICSQNAGPLQPYACPPDFIGTACALLDKAFITASGGVAGPEFTGYGSEDVDLCWRIAERGGLIARTRAVYVHHFHHASLADNALDPGEALRRANQILYAKWRDRLIGLCLAELARGGSLRDYLAAHFIFGPLARHTSFLADIRAASGRRDLPAEIIWRPEGL